MPNPPLGMPSEPLATIVNRYRAHNDKLQETLTTHVQVSTLADLEIITRNTHFVLNKALRRIARLEKRLGVMGEP